MWTSGLVFFGNAMLEMVSGDNRRVTLVACVGSSNPLSEEFIAGGRTRDPTAAVDLRQMSFRCKNLVR